jgi:hypothetical protein
MKKTPIPAVPLFAESAPRKNPVAIRAYRLGVIGMLPVVGLVLGPAAVVCGFIALSRYRANPKVEGMPQGRAAITLGTVSFLSNSLGLYCIAKGQGWLP